MKNPEHPQFKRGHDEHEIRGTEDPGKHGRGRGDHVVPCVLPRPALVDLELVADVDHDKRQGEHGPEFDRQGARIAQELGNDQPSHQEQRIHENLAHGDISRGVPWTSLRCGPHGAKPSRDVARAGLPGRDGAACPCHHPHEGSGVNVLSYRTRSGGPGKSCWAAIPDDYLPPAGRGPLVHWSSHPRTVSCHKIELCGASTQWFSSGKYNSLLGMPRRWSALNVARPWASTTR